MIDISFNNKNYTIDETSLQPFSAELQSHLTTVMNGTGATINLGGTVYNVDSTKLSSATNAFVSHLGTVAGNGHKVVVGGVEYGIDSAKMTDAVAEIHAVLSGLNSGESGESGGGGSAVTYAAALADNSWETIAYACQNNEVPDTWAVGDTKVMTLIDGTEVEMQIVAFNADEKADGSGTAAITWISKNLVAKRVMNLSETTADGIVGGWEASELRRWLQGEFYATLPAEVKSSIVSVNKTYLVYAGSGTYTTKTCTDNVWIPSRYEIHDVHPAICEDSGVLYTSYFTSDATRVKTYGGSICGWWLRSVYGGFYIVKTNGGINSANPSGSFGVALGFCM